MLIEAARRAEAAVKEMLAIANDGSATTDDLRDALRVSKSISGVNSAFQVSAAASVAGRERHGDGGAEVLASGAGLSRREAYSQVKTAEALRDTPNLKDAVESGRVSLANAKRLADAAASTSASDVEADADLLAKAESMRPEQFAKETRRWASDRQGDGGEADHARQRARRRVRIWDSDDGMVHLHGEFDAVTGHRIGNRLRAVAGSLHDADKQACNGTDDGARRSFDQCMADALDSLTANGGSHGDGDPLADICVVVQVDEDTGRLVAEIPGGERLPESVLHEIACNARLTGTIYGTRGTLLWQGHAKRTATKTQRKALKAIYGGCFACAAPFDMCDAHHVNPVLLGGPTDVDNMVPACWRCHNKIHHFGWQIRGRPGNRTLHPPDTAGYGPAHAPERSGVLLPRTPSPAVSEGRDAHHTRVSADAGVAAIRPGPASARAALRSARLQPLFTPD